MEDRIYQDIFNKLIDYLPEDWEKVVFFAGYTKGSYSMKFYIKDTTGNYTDCFNISDISKAALIKLFMDIDKDLSDQRKSLGEHNVWTVFTMQVDSAGHMKTDYEYADHSEDMVAYENVWEKKYLI